MLRCARRITNASGKVCKPYFKTLHRAESVLKLRLVSCRPNTLMKEISTADVRRLLIQHDPVFAVGNPGVQQDEYDLELPKVVTSLRESDDYVTLRRRLRQIFAETVGILEAGTVFRYSKLARDLMKLKLGRSF